MFRKIAKFSIRYRVSIIILFLIATIFMGIRIPKLEFDPNIKSMLPNKIDARLRLNRIEDIFGGTEFIQIGIIDDDIIKPSTLKRILKITQSLEEISDIEKVMSITNINNISGIDGDLVVEKLIKDIPESEQDSLKIKENIKDNEIIYGSLISKDFKGTVILAFITQGVDDAILLKKIINILELTPGNEEIHLGGLPIIRGELANHMKDDIRKFIPLGISIMLIFLLFCFKELRGILLPFLIVIMSIIFAMGTIQILGWKIQLVTVILPVILIAIANDYGIHLLARYQYEVKKIPLNILKKTNKNDIIVNVVSSLGGPVTAAGLTTVAGFLTLFTHIVTPAKQLGVLSAIGISYSILGSLFLIPALLSVLPLSNYSEKRRKHTLIDHLLQYLGTIVTLYPKRVVLLSLLIIFLLIPGFLFLKIDTDPLSFFNPDSQVVKSNDILTKYFGGSTNISLIATGDIMEPDVMHEINKIDNDLKNRDNIGQVTSIAQVLKQMNYVLNNNDPKYKKIPNSREAIAQYFLLYSFSGDPEDLEKMIDFEYENSMILARLSNPTTQILKDEFSYIKKTYGSDPDSSIKLIGGFGEILLVLSYALFKGQIISLLISLFVVGSIISFLFKTAKAGVTSIIPITLAIIILYSLMGYLGIKISTVTSMISSLMIGVGVDYTIHFLWHYKTNLNNGLNCSDAVLLCLNTSGKGIIFNAFSVIIGFLALLISNFLPVRFFGFLILTIIFSCLIGALIFLPALCIWLKPNWLNREKIIRKKQ